MWTVLILEDKNKSHQGKAPSSIQYYSKMALRYCLIFITVCWGSSPLAKPSLDAGSSARSPPITKVLDFTLGGLLEIQENQSKELERCKIRLQMKWEHLQAQPSHSSTGIRKWGVSYGYHRAGDLWQALPGQVTVFPTSTILGPDSCIHKPHNSRDLNSPTASPGQERPCLRSNHRAFYPEAAAPPSNGFTSCWERMKVSALSYDEMKANLELKVKIFWFYSLS